MSILNRDRLYDHMERNGLDAVIATSPENVTYCSEYWALSQWIRRGPQTYVVVPLPKHGEPFIVASSGLVDLIVDQPVEIEEVRKFGKFVVEVDETASLSEWEQHQADLQALPDDGSPQNSVIRGLKKLGLSKGVIGIDESGISDQAMSAVRDEFSQATFKPAFEFFRKVRAVKTDEEVRRLRTVAGIAEKSIDAALALAKPGVSESELGLEFNLETVRQGGLPVLYCIGTGPRSAMMNVQPGDRILREKDIIRFDVGGRYQHYRADIARIAVLGEPDPKITRYQKALLKGVEHAYEAIKPGVKACDVFHQVVDVVRREGIPHYGRSHVGHGIGLDGYDFPNITSSSTDVFEEGMVMCVETPYYELGFGGLQVEDMVVVRKDGLESLMTTNGALRVLPS